MEGGERKEEASLPPDYVSLAQLQERWLQKQEEIKRKQKQEEEEKREKQSLALKQKQEEDEKRERDVRAQNERNRNRNQRETGVIEEIGKGKDIVLGGPGDGGENNKKKRKKGKKKRNFRGAAAVEEKGKVGAEAEVLSGEGGSGGGTSGVEEVGYVCVVEVLPRNGEIAHVNRTDLRGEFKKNGRDKGSPRVNVLKQEGVNGGGNKWRVGERGRGVDRGRGAEEDGERGGDRRRGSERGGYRGRGREIGGDRRRGSESWGDRGRGGKNGGHPERKINMFKECRPVVLEGNEVDLKLEDKVDQGGISEVCSEIASLKVGNRNKMWGRDNRVKEDEAEGEGSNSDKVTAEIEKKVDNRVLARKGENGGSWKGYRAIEKRGCDNKAKGDGVEGEGSNGEVVAVELENKVDRKVLPRKGDNRGWRGGREYGIWERDNKAKEDDGAEGEGEGSNSDKVTVEIEKVEDRVLAREGENVGSWMGYRAVEIRGGDNKAKEDGVEGEGLNGEIVAVELEKKVDRKVCARNGQNRGYGRGYCGHERQRGGFGSGRRYTMPEISGYCKMQWVKKENKLDA